MECVQASGAPVWINCIEIQRMAYWLYLLKTLVLITKY